MSIIFKIFIILVLFFNSYKSVLAVYLDPVGYNGICPSPNYCMWFWQSCDSGFTATSTFPQCNAVLGKFCCIQDKPDGCDYFGNLYGNGSYFCIGSRLKLCSDGVIDNIRDCESSGKDCINGACVDRIALGECSSDLDCTNAFGSCFICQNPGESNSLCVTNRVNGGWSSTWTSCSNCVQYKLCNNPVAKCGGNDCSGSVPTQSCGLSVGASGECGYPVGVNQCFYNRTYPTCNNGNVNIIDDGSSGDNWVDWTCSGTAGACGGDNGATVGCSHHVAYTVDGGCLNNGGWFEGIPPSLCSNGATPQWVDSTAGALDFTYDWKCPGVCGGASPDCYSNKNTKPVFDKLEIKNTSGNDVTSDTESGKLYNHICQTDFNGTTARFVVTYFDAEGSSGYRGGDIDWIKLKIGSQEFTDPTYSRSGQYTKATFNINLSEISSSGVQRIWVNAKGNNFPENGYVGTNNYFKFWDCKVAVTGSIYDSSGVDPVKCDVSPYPGFTKLITSAANFTSLSFNSSSGNKAMSVSFPNPSYSSGSNKLIWGESYNTYSFNSDILMEVNPNFMDFRRNKTSCIDPIFELNRANVDPYVSSVGITIDFTGVVDQDPWWQVGNSGVISNGQILNRIPVTCSTCLVNDSGNGLVSSPHMQNTGRSGEIVFPWHYYGSEAKLANTNYGYDYFYNNYFVKNGIGLMADSMSEIGTSGVYFVDGNLNINSNNAIDANKSLMIVVDGDINVSNSVTQVNGILVAKNIGATGLNNSPLVFNGSLYAENTIDLSRGFLTKRLNNAAPAVKVVYNPAMIFKLPPETSKILTNYKWGN